MKDAIRATVVTAAGVVLALSSLGARAPAAEVSQESPSPSRLDLVEKDICRTNLDQIGQAILAYRKAQQTLPDRLSDLLHGYLANPEVLSCPTSKRIGVTSYDRAGYTHSEINDPATTYLYEFRTNRIPTQIGGGSRRSMREWKQLQMGLLGSDVPIVRCFKMHDPYLNLPFAGRVFESEQNWEKMFAHLVKPEDLSYTRLFARGTALRIITVPPRPIGATNLLLDLSAFYNASLSQCGSWEKPEDFLTGLQPGLKTFNGVQFDVRGCVQLYGDVAWLDAYPAAVTNIPVGLRGQRLHFLHAALHSEKPRTPIGSYRVLYEDGRASQIPISFGVQLAHWRANPKNAIQGGDSQIAWTGTNEIARARGKVMTLYQTQWNNPFPGVRMQTLDLASAGTEASPFVVAVTVEP